MPRGRADGLRFRATDQDWERGDGPEITAGPSEALALAIGGRAVALGDLDGPGLPVLRSRIGSPDPPAARSALAPTFSIAPGRR